MQNHANNFSDYNKHCLVHIPQKQELCYKTEDFHCIVKTISWVVNYALKFFIKNPYFM